MSRSELVVGVNSSVLTFNSRSGIQEACSTGGEQINQNLILILRTMSKPIPDQPRGVRMLRNV